MWQSYKACKVRHRGLHKQAVYTVLAGLPIEPTCQVQDITLKMPDSMMHLTGLDINRITSTIE